MVEDTEITVVGTVRGLVSEGPRLRKIINEVDPDLVALQISPEELKGLHALIEGWKPGFDMEWGDEEADEDDEEEEYYEDEEEYDLEEHLDDSMSNYERIYSDKLSRFGRVKLPPPDLMVALRLARKKGIPARAVDMNEVDYADMYVDAVRASDLIRHSVRQKRLRRKRFQAETPEDFVIEWDRTVNKVKGYANLEKRREHYVAHKLKQLSGGYKRIMVVVELQRAEGILKHLGSKDD